MIEVTGDLWTYPADYRVITTNGTIRKDGACVMGRGCAAEAKARYPLLPYDLGKMIRTQGNILWSFSYFNAEDPPRVETIITFPVKHHWREPADLELIRVSVEALRTFACGPCADESTVIVMPRPGCGNGRLAWEDVRPLLADLPDNVRVITFGEKS